MTDLLEAPAPAPASRPRRQRRLGAAALVVVVALVALGWHWATSLDVLGVVGQTAKAPATVGATYYVDAGVGPALGPDGLASDSVQVEVDAVTAGMTTRVGTSFTSGRISAVVCIRRPGTDGVGITQAAGLAASCSTVQPVRPGETLDLGFTTAQLLYVVPVTTAGSYSDFGMQVDYHQGLRHGTARGGCDLTLVAAH